MMKKNFAILFFIFLAQSSLAFAAKKSSFEEDEYELYEQSFSQKNEQKIYDPLEKINRKVFYINDFVDIHLTEPVAKGYRSYVPKFFRTSIRNFLINLSLPISAGNSFLQGKVNNGLATTSHFIINSTVGIGGIFNIAEKKKIYYQREDFGQTLGHYGASPGPFLILPLFGPSTVRDATGLAADTSVSFMGLNALKIGGSRESIIEDDVRVGYIIVSGVDKREDLLDVISDARKNSFDIYAAMRSLYIQNRNSKIKE